VVVCDTFLFLCIVSIVFHFNDGVVEIFFKHGLLISILLIAGLCSDDMKNTKDLAELKDNERCKASEIKTECRIRRPCDDLSVMLASRWFYMRCYCDKYGN